MFWGSGMRRNKESSTLVQVGLDIMGLREVICNFSCTWSPVDSVVALFYAILYPEIPHVDCFAAFEANRLIGNPFGSGVVSDNGGCRLGVSKI